MPLPDPEDYTLLLQSLRDRFAGMTEPMFTTDVSGPWLWEIFLGSLPKEEQAHHTCRSCQHFVERFGGLASLGSDGRVVPALWVLTSATPNLYRESVSKLAHLVSAARITGVFLSSEPVYGVPQNYGKDMHLWRHMAVPAVRVYPKSPVKTAHQATAEKLEEYRMLSSALAEYTPSTLEQAVGVLKSNALYRGDKTLGVATWLLTLKTAQEGALSSKAKENVTWLAVARAPAGYAHVKSTMIGTLLDDIQSGMAFAYVSTRFASKMDPEQYARAQAAPSAGQIAQAEKVIADLNAAGSLSRRFARLDEVPLMWAPEVFKTFKVPQTGRTSSSEPNPPGNGPRVGVFTHLTPKVITPPTSTIALPMTTLTWEKFTRTVLPDARKIEVQIPTDPSRFMALVTATNLGAEPILQWDHADARNPVSWYYHAGIDGKFRQRVERAGGQYENVDIRATLVWENRNDLDLHARTPSREHIFFGDKTSRCGGYLDIDMNVSGETTTPVENIRWGRGVARAGRYAFSVRNFRFHERVAPTPFEVELEVNGALYRYNGVISNRRETGEASEMAVFAFDYFPGGPPVFQGGIPASAIPAGASAWGLAADSWVPVSGITTSPNLWNADRPQPHHGRHMFFLLEGCKDEAKGLGRGFFCETLRAEYRPIARTLEAFMASAVIDGTDAATACGIGMTDQRPWGLRVRVTPKQGLPQIYLLDRWD